MKVINRKDCIEEDYINRLKQIESLTVENKMLRKEIKEAVTAYDVRKWSDDMVGHGKSLYQGRVRSLANVLIRLEKVLQEGDPQ